MFLEASHLYYLSQKVNTLKNDRIIQNYLSKDFRAMITPLSILQLRMHGLKEGMRIFQVHTAS